MTSRTYTYDSLKECVLDFIRDLQESVFYANNTEIDDMLKIKLLFERMHPEMVYKHIGEKLLPYKTKITSRDMNYFKENYASLFEKLDSQKADYYAKQLTDSSRIDDNDRNAIWGHLNTIIKVYNAI